MHSINALEVPEITQIIASYLSNVEPCLTVCRSWRSLYLPHYWREVEAGIRTRSIKDSTHWGEEYTPFFDPICHGHYIKFVRVLKVYKDFGSINQSLDYPNLKLLRFRCQWGEWTTTSDEDTVLKDFVNRHPLLECLDLNNIPPVTTNSVWTALVDHPRLNKVILGCYDPVPNDFWRVCARLRTLEFGHSDQRCIPNDLMLPSICRLKLDMLQNLEFTNQLDIIAACPLLEDLEWMGRSHMHPDWTRFGQLAAQGTWPHLRQLSTDFHLEDVDLAQVIASMHQATKVELYMSPLGPLSFEALQRHASTLQHLSIPCTADSERIRDVLCTFTRLECLEALRVRAKDIIEGGPWVCTFLRKLSVMVSFSSEGDYLQPAVFERISHLVHLEELTCYNFNSYSDEDHHGLIFQLQSGMAALASLSRLRHLELDPQNQATNFDDARWIADHWKRLETIRGRLSQDRSMNEQLKVLIPRARFRQFF